MAKGKLSEVRESTQKQAKNKVRKVLQTLQISADEQVVTGNNMVKPSDKVQAKEKDSKSNPKLVLTEKENITGIRRSKRKTATSSVISYAESPADASKTTKSSVKSISKPKKSLKAKKGCAAAAKKNEQAKLNQTKLQFSPVSEITTVKEDPDELKSENRASGAYNNEIAEDSGFDPCCGISDPSPMNSTAISKPSLKSSPIPYNDSILTVDCPPLSYWKDLAEQRRIALEKALHENELLHDQLTVLEVENSQLKQLVREAENLAQVVRAIVQ